MTEWSHLPNAAHIDALLDNLALYTNEFNGTSQPAKATAKDMVLDAAMIMRRNAARSAAWTAIWHTASDSATEPARSVVWTAVYQARKASATAPAYDAILAFVAYDHCACYLTMTPDELRVWSALSSNPACILLLPYISLLEHINKELV